MELRNVFRTDARVPPGDMTEDEGHDPGAWPEDEGIPDLQDGSPEAEWANDPQSEPVPGDEPVAVESFGTTFSEQAAGGSLDDRLTEEEPDLVDEAAEEPPDSAAGQLSDDPLAWRAANQDMFSTASPAHGLSGEEAAVHVAYDDDGELGLVAVTGGDESAEGPVGPEDDVSSSPVRPRLVDQDTGGDE